MEEDLYQLLIDKMVPGHVFFDSVPDGIVLADIGKKFYYWNKAAKEILENESHPEVDPKEWAQHYRLYHVNSSTLLAYEELPMVMSLSGKSYSDYRISTRVTPDSPEKILSVYGRPIMYQDKIVGGITTFRDITIRVKLERAIEAERNLYQNILDLLPGIVFIKDSTGKYTYANKSFLRLLERNNILGKETKDFLPPDQAQKVEEHDRMVSITGRPQAFEEDILWPDGERSVFHTVRFPFILSESVHGLCAVALDITKEREDQKKRDIEVSRIHQLSKLATIGMLASEIAHELQTPLTILGGYYHLLEQTLAEENLANKKDIQAQLQATRETLNRMSGIIRSLNIMSKDAQTQRRQMNRVQDIVEDVQGILALKKKEDVITFSIDPEEIEKISLEVNKVQIEEVLLNVIVNALDAVEDVPRPKVLVHISKGAHELVIEITDNGPGIAPELRDKIFESFFTTKENRGTGLGLSISRKILHEHGGTIDYFESELLHGFRMTIPL
jgi:PAS domain S-box-containing protein